MSYSGVSLKNNPEQQELARVIAEDRKLIVFCTGKAGTGKTFATLATALQLKDEKKYEKIIYARNPVQLGEDMGFLPGDVKEKYEPFMGGLLDNLESISRHSKNYDSRNRRESANALKTQIEIVPIAFLRGRSFENTILIIDEAQNLDLTALKTVLTRMGAYSKVILLGSMNQIDDSKQNRKVAKGEKCDFQRVMEKLEDRPYVATVELVKSMRSPICVELDELLGDLD